MQKITKRIVLGTAQLGMDYGITNRVGKPSLKNGCKIIQAAWESGVRYFDTAQGYGNSENILGIALNRLGVADKAFVISKMPGQLNSTNESEVLRSIDKTINALKSRYLYGLLLHNPLNLVLCDRKTERIIKNIRNEGLVKKFGISVYRYQDAIKAMDFDCFDIIQMPFNIFDQAYYSKGIFRKAEKRNKIVFLRSIFLQGLLLMDIEDIPFKQRYLSLIHI